MKIGALRFHFLVGGLSFLSLTGADASLTVAAPTDHSHIIAGLIDRNIQLIEQSSAENILDATVYAAAQRHARVDDIVEAVVALKPAAIASIPSFFKTLPGQQASVAHRLEVRTNQLLFKKFVTLYLHQYALNDVNQLSQDDLHFCNNVDQYNSCRFRKSDLYEEIFLIADESSTQQNNIRLLLDFLVDKPSLDNPKEASIHYADDTSSSSNSQGSSVKETRFRLSECPREILREVASFNRCSPHNVSTFVEALSFDQLVRLLNAKIVQADWATLETRTSLVKKDVSFLLKQALVKSAHYEGSAEAAIVQPILDHYVGMLLPLSKMLFMDDSVLAHNLRTSFFDLLGHMTALAIAIPDQMQRVSPMLFEVIDNFCINGLFQGQADPQRIFWSMMSLIEHTPENMIRAQQLFRQIMPPYMTELHGSYINVNRFVNLGFNAWFESEKLSSTMLDTKKKCIAVLSESLPVHPLQPSEQHPLVELITSTFIDRLKQTVAPAQAHGLLRALDKTYAPVILNCQVDGRFPLEYLEDPQKRFLLSSFKEMGADMRVVDNCGKTLLMRAIDRSAIDFFNFLLSSDDNPHVVNAQGSSVLEYLLLSSCSAEEVIKALNTLHRRMPVLFSRLIGDEQLLLSAWYEARCADNQVKHTVEERAQIVKVLNEFLALSL